MGRRLRTTVPILPTQLDPALPEGVAFAMEEREKRRSDAETYNRRHRVKALSALTAGERVWVTDTSGTVLQNHSTPRSYLVDLPQGVVGRNRSHLIPLHTPVQQYFILLLKQSAFIYFVLPYRVQIGTDLSTKRQVNPLRSDETKAVYPLFSRNGRCGIIAF